MVAQSKIRESCEINVTRIKGGDIKAITKWILINRNIGVCKRFLVVSVLFHTLGLIWTNINKQQHVTRVKRRKSLKNNIMTFAKFNRNKTLNVICVIEGFIINNTKRCVLMTNTLFVTLVNLKSVIYQNVLKLYNTLWNGIINIPDQQQNIKLSHNDY